MRARAARPFYDEPQSARPIVYFPLHVTDDYKIKTVIPHCVDQASIVEQVADALPPGYEYQLSEGKGRGQFSVGKGLGWGKTKDLGDVRLKGKEE